jgi:tRNA(adenine34) deaminase
MSVVLPPSILDSAMDIALAEAFLAQKEREVPIGAALFQLSALNEGRLVCLGRAHNQVEQLTDASAHAELLALSAVSRGRGAWRLSDVALVCTLEPCVMCLGAIRLARVPLVIFGAGDSRYGALGSAYKLDIDDRTGVAPTVISGIRTEECGNLLKEFFRNRRAEAD